VLGDIFDGAFRIIRYNPKATVGAAVLVSAVAMVLPVVTALISGSTGALRIDPDSSDLTNGQVTSLVATFGSLVLGLQLQSVGLLFVSGMIAHVASAAAVGRKLTINEAWAATHGKRWRLIGLTFLLGLMLTGIIAGYALTWVPVVMLAHGWQVASYGILTVPLFLCFLVWFWVRVYYLPVPALMLEPIGVTAAIGRAFRLTRRQFWRTFGIALLTVIIGQVAGSILAMPVSLVGQAMLMGAGSAKYGVLALVVTNALTSVISAAFVAPFTTTVASLQYLDQRMRKEAYDVELMARAGIVPS